MTELLPRPDQKRRRKCGKRFFFFVVLSVVLFSFLVRPLSVYLKPYDIDSYITTVFFVSRDGVIFDLTSLDASVIRTARTNSFEPYNFLSVPGVKHTFSSAGACVTEVKCDEEATQEEIEEIPDDYCLTLNPPRVPTTYTTTCSLETRNVDTQEVVSFEPIFRTEEVDVWTRLSYVLSEDKILFKSVQWERAPVYQCFWEIKANDRWEKIPIDFGLGDNVGVLGWEIVKEKESILFLLYSEEERKTYVSSYNYQTLSVEKTIELPPKFNSDEVQLRVLSGAQRFSVYQTVDELKMTKSIECTVYNTADLTKVKEISIPHVSRNLNTINVVVAPNLNYVAYGLRRLYLYDVKRGKSFRLRSSRSTFYRILLSDLRLLKPKGPSDAAIVDSYGYFWSTGFSKDSQTLYATDLLGDVFEWDVPTKKGKRKIVNMEY